MASFLGFGCTCCGADGGAVVTDESGMVASLPVHDETMARLEDADTENARPVMLARAPEGEDSFVTEPPPAPEDVVVDVGGTSDTQPSESQKEVEKVRLQQLFAGFLTQAAKGFPCKYLKEKTGELCATNYRIDSKLKTFTIDKVDPPKANTKAKAAPAPSHEVQCALLQIQDIYAFGQDGASPFPKEILQKVPEKDQAKLIMVVYKDEKVDKKFFRFCFLEETVETSNAFMQCMRILRAYVLSAAKP
jgi:hypothetical protein